LSNGQQDGNTDVRDEEVSPESISVFIVCFIILT